MITISRHHICTTRTASKPHQICSINPAPLQPSCQPPPATHHSHGRSCLLRPRNCPSLPCLHPLPHRLRLPPLLARPRHRAQPLRRQPRSTRLKECRHHERDQSAPHHPTFHSWPPRLTKLISSLLPHSLAFGEREEISCRWCDRADAETLQGVLLL
jgi:hypothetical protein